MSRRTITLTDAAPVEIETDDWPQLASAYWHDGQVECQANRRKHLIVRQHEDGRTIVYGVSDSNWQGETGRRRGIFLSLADDRDTPAIITAIRVVGAQMEFSDDFVQECIADLPAVEL